MTQAQQGRAASKGAEGFELKSASLSLLSLVLKTTDLTELSRELQVRVGATPGVFSNEPLLIDLSQLPQEPSVAAATAAVEAPAQLSLDSAVPGRAEVDLAALLPMLRGHRMSPVAVYGATPAELEQALALGLAEAPEPEAQAAPRGRAVDAAPVVQEVIREVVREVVREVPVPAESVPTLVIDKPLRSGQRIYAKGGDLVVLALVNHGAEVIADGHIHVYAPLRGKAIAGARGNTEARIFAASMEAELISIAGIYRTTENPLPDTVQGKPAQIRLEGEKLVMEALKL
ncbi:septum site-determining protein MinC [Kinneretia aquatilis]|uniref:septum site-determining protein MinC n=1 Tax=Kinneretia aquatilis TaxID=2070761 RepID=UPI00149517DD|nr:septum site-determining protein MinC [Paucibacter aquatile]WIV99386.1 septum site-determining protein MinC [Paucibacter aquatile]